MMMEFKGKEQIISEYMSSINFKNDDWSVDNIQNTLSKMIGEKPAIKIGWHKTAVVNELNSEATEVKMVKTIDVIFSPDLNEKVKKMSFTIGT